MARAKRLLVALPLAMLLGAVASAADDVNPSQPEQSRSETMKIRIRIGDKTIPATLNESATARDFVSLLPLDVTLQDYSRTEKICDLPRKLTPQGASAGSDPSVGDITYYAPWGNLAIFYKDFGYASGLIILGKIDSGIEALGGSGELTATIELAD